MPEEWETGRAWGWNKKEVCIGNRVPEEIWGKQAENSRGKIGPGSNFAVEDLGTGRC